MSTSENVTFYIKCVTVLSCPPAAAPSWHRWTPLRRCGCRSENTKKTEHVPSTGRPSRRRRRPAIAPRTALKTPPSYCRRLLHLLCIILFTRPTASEAPSASCSPPPRPEKHHVYVWCFRSYLLFMRLLLLLLLLQGDDDITRHPADIPNIHTHTQRAVRVCERAAVSSVDSYYRPRYVIII